MILSDSETQAALKSGQIRIEPQPSLASFTTTAVDLSLGGDDFKRWIEPRSGVDVIIDPAKPGFFANLAPYLESVPLYEKSLVLKPGEFVLALTRERVELPETTRVAARVEGKSSLARIGLGVHVTAPTIHSGFKGNITLEIKNHGVLPIRLTVGMPICQLIFEMVFGTPSKVMRGIFQDQKSVLGKP